MLFSIRGWFLRKSSSASIELLKQKNSNRCGSHPRGILLDWDRKIQTAAVL